jgi:AAA family ATP:ADP antiporter
VPGTAQSEESSGLVERLLRPFGEVRAAEALTMLLMFANIFAIQAGYNVLKTVREPLIINTGDIEGIGGAELKSFASAGQVLLLAGFIPLYGWFASRVDRVRLILGFNAFFVACIELFFVAGRAGVPYTGIAFFVWIGIFSYSVVAQFWSYANDIYTRQQGERLFPIIVVGMTAGAALGPRIAASLFEAGVDPYSMMQLGAGALVLSVLLYWLVERREERQPASVAATGAKLGGKGAFALIAGSRYLILIALTLMLSNWVNTNGEYILDRLISAHALTLPEGALRDQYVGSFRGNFFFAVNVSAALIQILLVSRIVKFLGIAGVIFALPIIAFGAYGLIGLGAGFAVTRWAKTAENATDYSVMNTAKQMLWLPTTREQKYKAKQATDTIFVRIGDLLTAGTVFVGTVLVGLGVAGFATINLAIVAAWLAVGWMLYRENRDLVALQATEGAPSSGGIPSRSAANQLG